MYDSFFFEMDPELLHSFGSGSERCFLHALCFCRWILDVKDTRSKVRSNCDGSLNATLWSAGHLPVVVKVVSNYSGNRSQAWAVFVTTVISTSGN